MRKVVLTGTYSSYNKGDAAMQIATAQAVKGIWPDSEVIISAPFPKYDKDFYKEYTVIKSTRRNLFIGSAQVFRAKTYYLLSRIGISLNFLINNEELKAFSEASIVIDLSGDTLTEDYGPHVTYSHFIPILVGLALNKPVFVCAQSIGPFKLTKYFSRYCLNKVSKITVREKITEDYLLSLGVKGGSIETTADMAFLLKPADNNHVDQILASEKLDISKKALLGVTVSNLVEDRFNNNKKDGSPDFASGMADLLDRIIKQKNVRVLFIGHVTGPSKAKDDRVISKAILEKMNNKDKAFVLNGDYRPDELKGVIARCSVFLGSRMHSNIGALSTSVPTIAIGYSHKTSGIMSMLGMDKYVYDIDQLDFDKLYSTIADALHNNAKITNKLGSKTVNVKQLSERNVDIIERLAE